MSSPSGPVFPISGPLQDKDLKRLVQETRRSTVGPTTTYYAGVTAPVIGAGMAFVSAMSLRSLDIETQWTNLIAALTAAMAGIVWYLIFMRWSYRTQSGRDSESIVETVVDADERGLVISRGPVTQYIAWRALKEIRDRRNYTLLCFEGADPLIVPDTWFGKDQGARENFQMYLREHIR